MATKAVSFILDAGGLPAQLSALSGLAKRLPEVRDGLLGLLDSGEELVRFDVDSGSATIANEVIVRPYPSDALFGLLAALGAGDSDLLLFEHETSPEVATINESTTYHYPQSGVRP
ncbi:hypothetical protein PWG15_24705 (plasmid) [Ensifer adhaerens]|uniref:hypothetical protein n=1 Tax=Ensifer adhaerens TaxID=106592 RepID=UPI0023A91801|nr:hypothetical protein [Ensifer adhaerens]WDZ80956.1 hypothetical protein PWG15_24705 [Ensifer adhaerens]